MTKKRQKEIEAVVKGVIDWEFENLGKIVCSEEYYKFRFLEYAIHNNNTVQCIGRTYVEMQKTYYKMFSHDANDLKQINQI